MFQKIASSQGGAIPDSEPEHVISIIERPSQMTMTVPAASSQTTPATPRPPPSSLPPHQLARVPSAAEAQGQDVRRQGRDVHQQLVKRIENLYRQKHHESPHHASTTTV